MGKSSSRKKKANGPASVPDMPSKVEKLEPTPAAKKLEGPTPPTTETPPTSTGALKMEHLAAVFLRRALELKEEGNRRFQSKDYHGAMENYEQALRLTPRNHPDRAVFHSNRAACLMQMKPVQYEAVVRECTLALEAHPCFGRALFRRARALEALGKPEFALQDVQLLLQTDGNNPDALELARRLRITLRNKEENKHNQEILARSRPSSVPAASPPKHSGTSPAALGASVVNGCPMAGKGPPKIVVKKKGKPEQPHARVPFSEAKQNILFNPDGRQSSASPSPTNVKEAVDHVCTEKLSVANGLNMPLPGKTSDFETQKLQASLKPRETRETSNWDTTMKASTGKPVCVRKQGSSQMRPLKLIYDHDIRLAKVPLGCNIKELRELVRKRFPSSKAVLIKYRDADGDLVTITSTEELRLAEAALEAEVAKKRTSEGKLGQGGTSDAVSISTSLSLPLEPLRLHVVEVPSEQEPVLEDEDEKVVIVEEVADSGVELSCTGTNKEGAQLSALMGMDLTVAPNMKPGKLGNRCEESTDKEDDENKGKEVEMDDWLVDFAQLFRTHIGVDPDVHIDLHELGMELSSEALEETVTSEEAQPLFKAAACKFQEVAALAFFNWGNVHMCAARKRIPLEGTNGNGDYEKRLQMAYDWAKGQYGLARLKYEEALKVKPDFYEGVLALGQESFESAKLQWSLATASQVDLTTWDATETLGLFSKAEEKMQIAFGMWEKLEEVRLNEAKLGGHRVAQREGSKGHRDCLQELSEAETKEQCLVMRFQISLFWGNILFEHSQVQYKLGLPSWKALLDAAVKKFELAGASPADIAVVMTNHISNSTCSCEATKPVTSSSIPATITEGDSKVKERGQCGAFSTLMNKCRG